MLSSINKSFHKEEPHLTSSFRSDTGIRLMYAGFHAHAQGFARTRRDARAGTAVKTISLAANASVDDCYMRIDLWTCVIRRDKKARGEEKEMKGREGRKKRAGGREEEERGVYLPILSTCHIALLLASYSLISFYIYPISNTLIEVKGQRRERGKEVKYILVGEREERRGRGFGY